jgi:hypothetical protein
MRGVMASTLRGYVLAALVLISPSLMAQVPAGVSYDPAKHPNPIVTWVQEKDFKPTTFSAAAEAVGVDLVSLSQDEGQRQSVELASPSQGRQRVRVAGLEIEVTFYPVMRQNYILKSGHTFVLYSFRFPRAATTAEMLNQAAFGRPPRGTTPRFGTLAVPDRIEIRNQPGLYFDDGKKRHVYWFERGTSHSATSDAPRDEIFRVLDDLL